jgi:hypothetical protein
MGKNELVNLTAIPFPELFEDYRAKGPEKFRYLHTHPFLVVLHSPDDEPYQLQVDTAESTADSLSAYTASREDLAKKHVVLLIKSSHDSDVARIKVGRARNSDITIRSSRISKLHCMFHIKKDGYLLEDMGSVNGTAVNSSVLKKGKPVKLKDGDIISIWRYAFEFIEADSFLEILERFPEE